MRGAYPALGPEMKSTGESGAFGDNIEEALLKSWLGAQPNRLPKIGKSLVLIYGPKSSILENAAKEFSKNFETITINGNYAVRSADGFQLKQCIKMLESGKIDMLVTDKSIERYDFLARRKAVDLNIPLVLDASLGYMLAKSMEKYKTEEELAKRIG